LGDTRLVKLLVLALLLGCSSPAKPKPVTPDVPAAGDPTCPLLVAGTAVTAEDTAEGPSLVFVTTGDAAAVRTRGQALAAMHNERKGADGDLGLMFTPGSTASASDVEGGVRVTFKGGQLDELQMHVKHLTGATTCVMH
jgi:hypothetical protein